MPASIISRARRQAGALTRDDILTALEHWIKQRPGVEFCNYADVANYRSEQRRITRQLHDARTLLAAVRWRASIDVPQLKEAFRAYSGRLTLREVTEPRRTGVDGLQTPACRLEYCTGQYWPTEYRAAVCAVLASALWDHMRASMPTPEPEHPGDWLRKELRREFGPRLASRWFN
jgi:hypothetical protein